MIVEQVYIHSEMKFKSTLLCVNAENAHHKKTSLRSFS